MPLTYYVDGYNVIGHSPALRALARQDFEAARDTLVDWLARFCSTTGRHATLVFDGRGRRGQPESPFRGGPTLRVMYSAGHHSADTLIERMVHSARVRSDIVVVSGDIGLRSLCHGLGSLVMAPDNFLETIQETLDHARVSLRNVQRLHRNRLLAERLSPTAAAQLKALKKHLSAAQEKTQTHSPTRKPP